MGLVGSSRDEPGSFAHVISLCLIPFLMGDIGLPQCPVQRINTNLQRGKQSADSILQQKEMGGKSGLKRLPAAPLVL
jgi:hypothetical protein